MENHYSPWLLNTNAALYRARDPLYDFTAAGYLFQIFSLADSCWLIMNWPSGSRTAFRLAYSPNDRLKVRIKKEESKIRLDISSLIGKYEVIFVLPVEGQRVIRYTTTLTPAASLLFPFWPRDLVPLGSNADHPARGEVRVKQVGTRSGQLYFSQAKAGSVFYLQNLTALADYNQKTETSAGDTVGGEWPEIGFCLPPVIKNKPLDAGKRYVLSDAVVSFSEEIPKDEPAMIRQYLDMLAMVYMALPKPATNYQHWPDILQKGLTDLIDSPGCWSQVDGNQYFNAYVCDYVTPPEIMVQLAVLLPLLDYVEWSGGQLEIMKKIKEGLPAFYDKKYRTIMRWHPKATDKLDGEEEQKQPLVMDSWYLHHPLLNLSRLALKGDKAASKLFLDSLEFSIKVAHHFKYQWPVFYKMDTLEVVKAETQPGMGGEKDVPGLYALVMLQALELTGNERYLQEAEKSAKTLEGLGFSLFYQANNTAFAAGAMLKLYQITGDECYLNLSYLCLANIFENVRLWDCNYGYGRSFPSFFTLFPLSDAPYTAVYEEQEVFCAFHDYLRLAEGIAIAPSVRLLVSEYIRFLVHRAAFYYPPMLPKETLAEKPKIGEVDPNLWIALEDLHDGWEKGGQVGQEVYGAGNAFGILPRHYMQVEEANLMVYTDYPIYGFSPKKHRPVRFRLAGDSKQHCRLMIVKTGKAKLPVLTVSTGAKQELKGKKVAGGNLEFDVPGDSEIYINWK
jgi:hypothetical protein